MPACNRGTIRRKSFTRKSYTRKNGIHVRGTHVSSACIKDQGQSGKWTVRHGSAGIGPLKAGKLSKLGYSSSGTVSQRHAALQKAIRAYGALATYRMLNAVYIYSKRTTPAKSATYKADRDWIGAAHGFKHN